MSNKEEAKDPWGHDYVLRCGSDAPAEADGSGVISAGPDGKRGTADDISSWQRPSR